MGNTHHLDIYIDTHSHMFADAFDEDRAAAIDRALAAGVYKIILPNIDLDTIERMYTLCKDFPGHCYSSIGLHPTDVNEDYIEVLAQMQQKYIEPLHPDHLIAIGETGLDYYWDKSKIDLQKEALKIQIQWAKKEKLPIILHTRESTRDTIDIIRQHKTEDLTGVFHCFSGTQEEALEVLDLGFYIGVGGTITYKKNSMREWIDQIPLEHIVLETDAPYLSPVPYRGKRNESSYIPDISAVLAELYALPLEQIATKTTANALSLFTKLMNH